MKTMSWYQSWFDSPFYHVLYRHRNEAEAELFLRKLTGYLQPVAGAKVLDLACGKGRHSIYLNSLGYQVTGTDLSASNIRHCKSFENDTLTFYIHDMRRLFRVNAFDLVLNLFTSFGYFENDRDHQSVIRNASLALKPGGTLVIDFMNSDYARAHLVESDTRVIDGTTFHIQRKYRDGFIVKDIHVTDSDTDVHFSEKVATLGIDDFHRYFEAVGLKPATVFGDYGLGDFDPQLSPRLILTAIKS